MDDIFETDIKLSANTYRGNDSVRSIDLMELSLPSGYVVDVYAEGLDSPIGIVFSDTGDLFIADSGLTSGRPRIFMFQNGRLETIAEGFMTPITGINYLDGDIYVSHKGYITVIRSNGTIQNILAGLPCNGDFYTSNVAFGPDGKMYFGQGTATNSGVVGNDNEWVFNDPLFHDESAFNVVLTGQNFETYNMLVSYIEKTYTGAFSPYGVPNMQSEFRKGLLKASGTILKANRDGTELELVATGFRNPFQVQFNKEFQLFVANRGYDVRGSRPIANAPDEFHIVTPGMWYGWPDYSAGEPIILPKFQPEGGLQPEFLLFNHPNVPPRPFVTFPPHTSISGFDFNNHPEFGNVGDVYIAELGSYGPYTMGRSAPYDGIGHQVSKIDFNTRIISTFISNKSGLPATQGGGGGLGRPIDIVFGPDGAMYILDVGISNRSNFNQFIPNTGVIWRVRKT